MVKPADCGVGAGVGAGVDDCGIKLLLYQMPPVTKRFVTLIVAATRRRSNG